MPVILHTQCRRILVAALVVVGLVGLVPGDADAAAAAAAAADGRRRDTMSDTWVATDALGRTLPSDVRAPRADRFVGMFYFLWMQGRPQQPVIDISRLLKERPQAPAYGPLGAFHWWGEPQLGYYDSNDEAVIAIHAQLLSDAGVDVILCDVTNALTYDETCLALLRTFARLRAAGRRTPQIAFLANSKSVQVAQRVYETIYVKRRHPELWFHWLGKPLLLCPPQGLSEEVLNFFTVRHSWAWSAPKSWFGDGKDRWPWIDNHPQKPGWHVSPDQPEAISVCVAQHAHSNIGRSFHAGRQPPPDQIRPEAGLGFSEQWKRAIEVDPQFVLVTGWNEWIAQRFERSPKLNVPNFIGRPLAMGGTLFIDQYNQEYSRDIEPMRGGHGDSYYYQLVSNIRRFKGARQLPPPSPPVTIAIPGALTQWDAVTPRFLDDAEDPARRDHGGYDGRTRYVNSSGRNDLLLMQVARDARFVYFHARTREPLTAPAGSNWMLLFLEVDGNPATGWCGYDLVINRSLTQRDGRWIGSCERSASGWNWRPVGEAAFTVDGCDLQLALPRSLLASPPGPLRLDFKWADGIPATGDALHFMDHGDAAPNGRFNYRFSEVP